MATKKNKTENKVTSSKIDSLKSILGNVAENVIEGATLVTEKIKGKSAEVYVAGTELVEDANEKIHQFSDRVFLQKEHKRIENRQKEIVAKFGEETLRHYIKNESLHKAFLTTKIVDDLVNEHKLNNKNLIAIERKIKKINL